MTTTDQAHDRDDPGNWAGRVAISTGADRVAYVPGELLTTAGDRVEEEVRSRRRGVEGITRDELPVLVEGQEVSRLRNVPEVMPLVSELRSLRLPVQPNHVLFASCGGGCCCGPHPAQRAAGTPVYGSPVYGSPVYGSPVYGSPVYGSPVYGSPVYGSPVYGSPVYGSPVYGSPVYGSPVYGSPVYGSPVYGSPVYGSPVYGSPASHYVATGRRRSSARPAEPGAEGHAAVLLELAASVSGGPQVVVLDTGLAHSDFRPAALAGLRTLVRPGDRPEDGEDVPDHDADQDLDPCAGHGTFVAGLVASVAPGAQVTLHRVLGPLGDGAEADIVATLAGLADAGPPPGGSGIVNLSFSGYSFGQPEALAAAVRAVQAAGYVVVAAAGNDGVCRPTVPASLPGVVAVGALGPAGPAPFTNYGDWVRACAPGVDVVAPFFAGWRGPEAAVGSREDPDDFAGWACWSGTSMSAPIVAGALAREMMATGASAGQAVERIVDGPALLRLAGLGTVVNVA